MKGKIFNWNIKMGRERWAALARALGVLIIYVLLYFSVGLPVGVGYFFFARYVLDDELREATLHMEDALLILHAFAMVLVLLAMIGVVQFTLSKIERRGSFREIGFRSSKRMWLAAMISFLLASTLVVGIFLSGWATGQVYILEPIQEETLWTDILTDLLGSLILFAAIAGVEELVFRGYIRFTLMRAYLPTITLVISAVMFAFTISLLITWSLLGFLNALLAGLILGMLFLATGSIWVPILAHFGWIFTASFLFSFPTAGFFSEGLVLTRIQPGLLMGSSQGPEDGFFTFGALLLTTIVLWLFTRRRLRINALNVEV